MNRAALAIIAILAAVAALADGDWARDESYGQGALVFHGQHYYEAEAASEGREPWAGSRCWRRLGVAAADRRRRVSSPPPREIREEPARVEIVAASIADPILLRDLPQWEFAPHREDRADFVFSATQTMEDAPYESSNDQRKSGHRSHRGSGDAVRAPHVVRSSVLDQLGKRPNSPEKRRNLLTGPDTRAKGDR